ncbi:MAG: hypothetical protein ABJN39_09535 [Sulfitobacter sp.]|uniref:hypothetical protein n=1 Tax=Alphaproteobacteria TaxID=28211 RepID=UPI002942B59F|nr:hypothetical protein [Sulfitobacter sp. LC.270.F.C4]WOI13545.1 hypothetical protein R1T45_01935 [Sulfitobacter sp. LC.270.F.C4]
MTEQVDRDKVARLIMLDHLQLLSDFDVDGDIYRKDPECAASVYSTADAIIAALTVTPQEAAEVRKAVGHQATEVNRAFIIAANARPAGAPRAIHEVELILEKAVKALRAISEDSQ